MIEKKLHLLLLACAILCVTATHAGDSASDPDFSLDLRDVDIAMELASAHMFGYATQMQADCGKAESIPDFHSICSERKTLALAAAQLHQKEMEQAEQILGNVSKVIGLVLRKPDQNASTNETEDITKNLKLLRMSFRRLQSLSEAYHFKDRPLARQIELAAHQGIAPVPSRAPDGLGKQADQNPSSSTKTGVEDR